MKKHGKKPGTSPKQYVDIIYQNSSGMLDLVNDILDAAKIQAGKFEISREPADIAEVLENRLAFFNISAADKKIRLQTVGSEKVPKSIPLDVQRVKQVLNNLLSNAIKFTTDGGSVTISTIMHEPGIPISTEVGKMKLQLPDSLPEAVFASLPQSLVVTVTDSGIGIDTANMPKLFSKFKQLDNKTLVPNSKGTGLGLAIAKGIIDGHGGSIGVVSRVGVGSTFYFTIPIADTSLKEIATV